MISNSGSDENGNITGGKPGDQTGNEWTVRTWYSRPWNCVLRYPDQKVRETLADLSRKSANNDRIGYNQSNRDSYWKQLQIAKYDPSKITVNCDADCSSGVIANTKAVGYLTNKALLKNINATYTGNMRAAYKNAGFECLTDIKYLTSDSWLQPGDILLNDLHHTAVNLDYGKSVTPIPKVNTNYKLTVDIYLRTGYSTKSKQAGYIRYDQLQESTKSKVKIKSGNKVMLKKGVTVYANEIKMNDIGDWWLRSDKGYWLPIIVKGKARYKYE